MSKVLIKAMVVLAIVGAANAYAKPDGGQMGQNPPEADKDACCGKNGDLGSSKAACEQWAMAKLNGAGVNQPHQVGPDGKPIAPGK